MGRAQENYESKLLSIPTDARQVCSGACTPITRGDQSIMTREIEFTVEKLDYFDGKLRVAGRCAKDIIKVGDCFTAVYRYAPAQTLEDFGKPSERIAIRNIALWVEKMTSYSRLWDEIHPGLTAELELSGEGEDKVRFGDVLGATV